MNSGIAYLMTVLALSFVTFTVYGFDKRRAVNGGRRVSEQTLQLLAFLGGWPGALLGQRQFRHKTQKASFLIVFWGLTVLHIAIVSAVVYSLLEQPA